MKSVCKWNISHYVSLYIEELLVSVYFIKYGKSAVKLGVVNERVWRKMVVSVDSVELGVIVCTFCGELIDTLDAEKVMIYYSNCKKEQCNNQVSQK